MKTFAVHYKQRRTRGSMVQLINGVDEIEASVVLYSRYHDSKVTNVYEVNVDQELKTQADVVTYLKRTGQYQD